LRERSSSTRSFIDLGCCGATCPSLPHRRFVAAF
jgi:hypothetical protein